MPFNYPQLQDFKAGDTLSLAGTCVLPDGTWTATCSIRTRDTQTLVGNLTVALGTPVDGVTPVVLTAPASETITWAPGPCLLDVRYVDSTGAVAHTSTIGMRVIAAITRPAP